jgi:inhibitor of KinA
LSAYRELKRNPPGGVLDVVPAYTELAVHFDPLAVDPLDLRDEVEAMLSCGNGEAPLENSMLHRLPVVYDGQDLDRVAAQCDLTEREVVHRHTAPVYTVAMIGFLPHFPYCLGLDETLILPRLASPRTSVPAGSVAVAGRQTGVYPVASPGGWNLLGRTDPDLLRDICPGDRVRFEAVEVLP